MHEMEIARSQLHYRRGRRETWLWELVVERAGRYGTLTVWRHWGPAGGTQALPRSRGSWQRDSLLTPSAAALAIETRLASAQRRGYRPLASPGFMDSPTGAWLEEVSERLFEVVSE
jgi:hypothetical protein